MIREEWRIKWEGEEKTRKIGREGQRKRERKRGGGER